MKSLLRGSSASFGVTLLILAAGSPYAYAADDSCPTFPSGNVYAYVCSQTSDLGDGVALQVTNGQTIVSTTGLGGIDTATLGSPGQAFLNGQFGATGTSGAVATTQSETVINAYGAGSETASAGIGDKEYATFTSIPFANGNTAISTQRFEGNVVVPSLHAAAKGSATASTGGVSALSGSDIYFSDVLSITQQQLYAADQYTNLNLNLNGIYVGISYEVFGTFTASVTGANASGSLSITASNQEGVQTGGGSAKAGQAGTSDSLTGRVITLYSLISPTDPLTLQVNLGVDGTGTASGGVGAIYDANLSDTAQFLGVSFWADADATVPLPDIQLGSALGLDYIPSDAIVSSTGPATSVPEPGTWALMGAGFAALAAFRLRERAARA